MSGCEARSVAPAGCAPPDPDWRRGNSPPRHSRRRGVTLVRGDAPVPGTVRGPEVLFVERSDRQQSADFTPVFAAVAKRGRVLCAVRSNAGGEFAGSRNLSWTPSI